MRVVSEFLVLGRGCAPFEGWRIVFRCPWKTAVRGSCAASRRHEHRSPVQLAAGLTALSRCAIPHEMVTTDRVANSHSIIRSSRRAVHVATSAWARSSGGPPVVALVFPEFGMRVDQLNERFNSTTARLSGCNSNIDDTDRDLLARARRHQLSRRLKHAGPSWVTPSTPPSGRMAHGREMRSLRQ